MIEILITRQDNSVYWRMMVNSMEEASAWVSEEQTRHYWDSSWTVTITDLS